MCKTAITGHFHGKWLRLVLSVFFSRVSFGIMFLKEFAIISVVKYVFKVFHNIPFFFFLKVSSFSPLWTISIVFIEFVIVLFPCYVWFFGHGILAP